MNRSTLIRAGMKVGAFNVVGRSKGRFQFQSLCAREDRGEKYRWRCVFPGRTCETAAAICNLQKSERFCRSVNGRANWKTSVRRLPVTGARSARLRSLPFCRPTTDFSLPAFRLTSPRPFLFNFVLRIFAATLETETEIDILPSISRPLVGQGRGFSFRSGFTRHTMNRTRVIEEQTRGETSLVQTSKFHR